MIILAIDTSSPQASLVLWDSATDETVWQHSFITDRSHNSKIFTSLKQALEANDQPWDLIVIGTGPGSYSGVRVGIAAANGISLAMNTEVIGTSSLVAYSKESDFRVVGDARRNSFFLAEINQRSLVAEPKLLDSEAMKKELECKTSPVYSMDSHVAEQFELIKHRYPSAKNLAQHVGKAPTPTSPQAIEPHYLRPPFITKAKKKPVPGF